MEQMNLFEKTDTLHIIEEYSLVKVVYESKIKKITSSTDINEFIRPIMADKWNVKEYFYVIFLDRSNQILGFTLTHIGGLSGCVVDKRLILSNALLCGASQIIAVHNHPSGRDEPSQADKQITTGLASASRLLDICLLDHIIYAGNKYFSFCDQGLI